VNLGARPSGAREGEASSRRAASSRAVHPARPWARRSRALQRAAGGAGWERVPLGRGRGRGNILLAGGVSACDAPGTTVGPPEPCPPAGGGRRGRVNLGARPAGARGAGGEVSSRRAASPHAMHRARPWARRSRALQRAARARGGARAQDDVARPSGARAGAGKHSPGGRRLRMRCTGHDGGHAGAVPSSGPRGAGAGGGRWAWECVPPEREPCSPGGARGAKETGDEPQRYFVL